MALFASEYQGGPSFEVFSSQGSNPLANWKVSNQKGVKKVYEKAVKGYVYTCHAGPANKLQLPKEERKGSASRRSLARALVLPQRWRPPRIPRDAAVPCVQPRDPGPPGR